MSCPDYFNWCANCERHLVAEEGHTPIAYLAFPLVLSWFTLLPLLLIPDPFANVRTSLPRLPSPAKDHLLSRKLPGFLAGFGTAEVPNPRNWTTTRFSASPGWGRHCGATLAAKAPRFKDQAATGFSSPQVWDNCCWYSSTIWFNKFFVCTCVCVSSFPFLFSGEPWLNIAT